MRANADAILGFLVWSEAARSQCGPDHDWNFPRPSAGMTFNDDTNLDDPHKARQSLTNV